MADRDAALLAARRRIRVRIEAPVESGYASQYVAFRLAHALATRHFAVSVTLVGGDKGEVEARRSRIRAV
jgi:hypothetical protein